MYDREKAEAEQDRLDYLEKSYLESSGPEWPAPFRVADRKPEAGQAVFAWLAWMSAGERWSSAIYRPDSTDWRWDFGDWGCPESEVEFWLPQPPDPTSVSR